MDKLTAPLAALLLLGLFVWVSNDGYKESYNTLTGAITALERGRIGH